MRVMTIKIGMIPISIKLTVFFFLKAHKIKLFLNPHTLDLIFVIFLRVTVD